MARAYGRDAFMRSCALRILDAETISSARVTLRVFCTDLILVLISRPPAISSLALLARRDSWDGIRDSSGAGFARPGGRYKSRIPNPESRLHHDCLNSLMICLNLPSISPFQAPVETTCCSNSP